MQTPSDKSSGVGSLQTDDNNKIQILNNNLEKNYSGDYTKLQKLNLSLFGLKESLKRYEPLL